MKMTETELMRQYQTKATKARNQRDNAIKIEDERHEATIMRLNHTCALKIDKLDYWLNTTEAVKENTPTDKSETDPTVKYYQDGEKVV